MPDTNPKPDTTSPTPPDAERRPTHDAAWKQFFGLPIALVHLMRGFFPEVAALLDLATARPISAEWALAGQRRLADAVWRVDYKDGSKRTLDVVLEFQSTVAGNMASRMMELDTMAYVSRRAADDLAPNGHMRMLRVVVHTSDQRWTAPGTAHPTVTATGEVATEHRGYAIVCARRDLDGRPVTADDLPPRNVISTLFVLCGADTVQDIETTLRELAVWLPELGSAGTALPTALADWLTGTAPKLLDGIDTHRLVARVLSAADETESNDMTIAIEERFVRYGNSREKRGIELGEKRGIELGERRGEKRGIELGERRGEKRGIELGERRGEKRGIELGIEKGQRDLLRRQAARKFSTDAAERLADYLARSADAARLAQASDWIADCATDEDLLANLANDRPVNGATRS